MTNHEGEKEMKAGVKSIQLMKIEFDTQAQAQKIINWASGQGEKKRLKM